MRRIIKLCSDLSPVSVCRMLQSERNKEKKQECDGIPRAPV
jgi:hypothetical protein